MAGPVDTAGWRVAKFLCHDIGGYDTAGAVGFHHGNGGGGAADFCHGLVGCTQSHVGPAGVRLLEAGDSQGNGGVDAATGQVLAADIACLCTMIQNMTPTARTGQDCDIFAFGKLIFDVVGCSCATSNIQITAVGQHGCCVTGKCLDVVRVTVAVAVFGVFYLPPVPGTGKQSDVTAVC